MNAPTTIRPSAAVRLTSPRDHAANRLTSNISRYPSLPVSARACLHAARRLLTLPGSRCAQTLPALHSVGAVRALVISPAPRRCNARRWRADATHHSTWRIGSGGPDDRRRRLSQGRDHAQPPDVTRVRRRTAGMGRSASARRFARCIDSASADRGFASSAIPTRACACSPVRTAQISPFVSPYTARESPPLVRTNDSRLDVSAGGSGARVVGALMAIRPTLVVLPHCGDQHPDHCATHLLVHEALRDALDAGLRPPRLLHLHPALSELAGTAET